MAHAFGSGFWRGAKEEAREGDMGGGRAFARVSDPVISPPAPGNRPSALVRALLASTAHSQRRSTRPHASA